MKTAKLVRKLESWRGDARLYQLSEPHEGYSHVVVSAVVASFTGPETYIFGSDADGNNDWTELDGSTRGVLDHAAVLLEAGYETAATTSDKEQ